MPNIDTFRIAELDERLTQIRAIAENVREPIEPAQGAHYDEVTALSAGDFMARSGVVLDFDRLLFNHLCPWAVDVVDAFGIDSFPTYIKEPPAVCVPDFLDRNWVPTYSEAPPATAASEDISLAQWLTGVDDLVQAGLRIIWWAAATGDPKRFGGKSGGLGVQREWAMKQLIRERECYRAGAESLEWMRLAFDQLVAEWNSRNPGGIKGAKKIRITCDVANIRVGELLKAMHRRKQKPSLRLLAEKVKCSKALIAKTSNWKAHQTRVNVIKQPKAVGLTDKLQQELGKGDAELEELIADQKKDLEQSPLVDGPNAQRPRRRRV